MKKILNILVLLAFCLTGFAQSNIPQLVSFSAIVRDANNQPLVNTAVSVRLTFKQGGQNGPMVYCALHQTLTNQNGYLSLQLNRTVLGTGCNGAPSTAFQNIPWENGGFWMEVEYQTVPTSPFISLGQLELASSFYAFAAATAERLVGFNLAGANNGDLITYNLSTGQWEPRPPGSGSFSGDYNDLTNKPVFASVASSGDYNDLTNTPVIPVVPTNVSAFTNDAGYISSTNDNSSTNELQQWTVSRIGDTLHLSKANWVIIRGISAANYVSTIGTLNCIGATRNGTLSVGVPASNVTVTVPYSAANGGSYNAQTISSSGVNGLTATLNAGMLVNGSGSLVFNISGTPASSGQANFTITIGGQTCTFSTSI